MLKRVILFTALTIIPIATWSEEAEIRVSNALDFQRQEVVEVSAAAVRRCLGIQASEPIVVRNALGQEVSSQLTHDGLLLFEAAVRPNGMAVFTVSCGKQKEYTSFVYGKVYKKRLDDLTFENDRGIYRMYGPALQTTGERSFGTDLWTKSTPFLDAQNRYEAEFGVRDTLAVLRSEGNNKAIKEILDRVSYHLDHGTGFDAYGCGPSLGCGAPAIITDGRLVMPYCWQQCEILDNGPLRFSAHLAYGATEIKGVGHVVEHRLIQLDKGSNFCRLTVWYEEMQAACQLASGVVIHKADTTSIVLSPDYALYADPTDRPTEINQQIYVGTLYPYGHVQTMTLPFAEQSNVISGHAIGVTDLQPNERFTYFFGMAWSQYDVRTFDEWQLIASHFVAAKRCPLSVQIVINNSKNQ